MKRLVILVSCVVLAFIGSAAAFEDCGTVASFTDLTQKVGSRFQLVVKRGRDAGPKYGALISCKAGDGTYKWAYSWYEDSSGSAVDSAKLSFKGCHGTPCVGTVSVITRSNFQ